MEKLNTADAKDVEANMKVPAPDGYHWMKDGKSYKIMKDPKEGFKPHKGASKSVNFPVKKAH